MQVFYFNKCIYCLIMNKKCLSRVDLFGYMFCESSNRYEIFLYIFDFLYILLSIDRFPEHLVPHDYNTFNHFRVSHVMVALLGWNLLPHSHTSFSETYVHLNSASNCGDSVGWGGSNTPPATHLRWLSIVGGPTWWLGEQCVFVPDGVDCCLHQSLECLVQTRLFPGGQKITDCCVNKKQTKALYCSHSHSICHWLACHHQDEMCHCLPTDVENKTNNSFF